MFIVIPLYLLFVILCKTLKSDVDYQLMVHYYSYYQRGNSETLSL